MKDTPFLVKENEALTDCVYRMVLVGDTSAITAPGQFINIMIDGLYLRRPISVYDYDDNSVTIVYKVVGEGTEVLKNTVSGSTLQCLTGLGNGYTVSRSGDAPLLVGGGVGIPPLYRLAKELVAQNKQVTAVLGFNTKSEMFLTKEFEALGVRVLVCCADGSYGIPGFVTEAVRDLSYTYFYACGPEAMEKALDKVVTTSGEYSFEERMGCGFGACMGCSCETKYGNLRICKDGPVLQREVIVW